jgi:hypothetical protein
MENFKTKKSNAKNILDVIPLIFLTFDPENW